MPATIVCIPKCSTSQTVNIPGVAGADGLDGQNAFTQVVSPGFVVPAVGFAVAAPGIPVVSSDWCAIGQTIVCDGPATFTVLAKPDSTHISGVFLGATGDVIPGTVISAGANVSPAGVPGTGGGGGGAASQVMGYTTTGPTADGVVPPNLNGPAIAVKYKETTYVWSPTLHVWDDV